MHAALDVCFGKRWLVKPADVGAKKARNLTAKEAWEKRVSLDSSNIQQCFDAVTPCHLPISCPARRVGIGAEALLDHGVTSFRGW